MCRQELGPPSYYFLFKTDRDGRNTPKKDARKRNSKTGQKETYTDSQVPEEYLQVTLFTISKRNQALFTNYKRANT